MMKKWQEKRNYRRIKDEHGHIIKNIITVDGVDVEVSEEVFLSYSQMERRERYITEEVEPGRLLSLERLLEDGVPLELLGGEQEKSAEYTVFDQMDKMNIDRESQLIFALSNLDPCKKNSYGPFISRECLPENMPVSVEYQIWPYESVEIGS